MAPNKEVGDAALFVYNLLHTTNSRRPYLRRNVREVLEALTMGNTLSSLKSSIGPKAQDETALYDEEDEQHRPAKRRKLSLSREAPVSFDSDTAGYRRPLSHVSNGSRRNSSSSKPDPIKPVNFYGTSQPVGWSADQYARPRLSKPRKPIDECLPEMPVDFSEAMRVNIFQINAEHDEPPASADWGQIADINCKCSVAIYYAKNDKSPGDVRPQDFEELCKINKSCIYRIEIGPDGEASRDIILAEPFIFTPDNFYTLRKPAGQPDRFGFADRYQIKVFIQPKETSELWPAMRMASASGSMPAVDVRDGEDAPREEICFYAKTNPWFPAHRHSRCDLYTKYKTKTQRIGFSLHMQIEWTLPNRLNDHAFRRSGSRLPPPSAQQFPKSPRKMEDPLPSLETPRKVDEPLPPESPGEGRAARRRAGVVTYNLKALSSMAQGKSPRRARVQKTEREEHILEDGEVTVTYCFGKAEAAETGIKRETTISGLKCPFCLSQNRSLDELRLHLSTDHSAYKFHLRRPKPPRITFFVELAKSRRSGTFAIEDRSRILQMGQPMSLFDLDKHLNGDESWTRSRTGALHNKWPVHLLESHLMNSSRSSSSDGTRKSSPNTPHDADDLMDVDKSMDFDYDEPQAARKQRKIHYVPKIAHPLFDSVTKGLLTPGEVLATSDDDTDESWLHQHRRDAINDFTDIPPEEKEYINRFNPFICEERLTSMEFLPDAIVRFVMANKEWIMAKASRRMEFYKHMDSFILRGNLDEELVMRCRRILNEVSKAKGEEEDGDAKKDVDMGEVERPVSLIRGLHACICGNVTTPPNRVVCRGTKCPARFYCRSCAQGFQRPITGQWKCPSCFS
ncbi:hypothetical protein VTL71DRAFT_2759, partial [Oculimacula yallundae]